MASSETPRAESTLKPLAEMTPRLQGLFVAARNLRIAENRLKKAKQFAEGMTELRKAHEESMK